MAKLIEYFADKYPHMDLGVMASPRGFTSYADWSQCRPYLEYIRSTGICGIAANMELKIILTNSSIFAPKKPSSAKKII